jgi:outer membrane receptor protein involved in Fe transport
MAPSSFADIGGYAVVIPIATDWWTDNAPSWRAAPTYNIGTNLSVQKSRHSLSFGGGWLRSSAWENAQQMVPQVNLGFNNTFDPAIGMFNTTNFPGASNNDLSNARAIYGMLTGRVTSINSQAALDPATGQYVLNGPRRREGFLDVWSAFAQDQWRVKPTVTISAGVRYDLQTPFQARNDTMTAVAFDSVCGQSGRGSGSTFDKCGFYQYKNTGVVPEFIRLTSGTNGYETDFNNVSPSISVAWRPNVQSGFMRTLLGDPEQAHFAPAIRRRTRARASESSRVSTAATRAPRFRPTATSTTTTWSMKAKHALALLVTRPDCTQRRSLLPRYCRRRFGRAGRTA